MDLPGAPSRLPRTSLPARSTRWSGGFQRPAWAIAAFTFGLGVWAPPEFRDPFGIVAAAQVGVPDDLPGLEKAPPFVAEVVVTNAQVKGVAYRMYYMPGMMRLESLGGAQDGDKQVILSHLRENISYVDIGGTWFKLNNNALGVEGLSWGNTTGFRTQKIGKRFIDGKPCDGYKFTSPDGATRVEQWLWGEYPIVATVQNRMGTTTAKYLSLRPQRTPESLFYPPRDAQIQDLDALGVGGLTRKSGQQADPAAQLQDIQKLLKEQGF